MRPPTSHPRARRLAARAALLPVLALCIASAAPEQAALVVDLESGRVLHARNAELLHPPASLAKLMTAYLAFEALREGRLEPAARLPVSQTAAGQPPLVLGTAVGDEVRADTLLRAVLLRSANDAAVVLAEALAGSEAAFAKRMTARARSLGLPRSRFRNASGLPRAGQVTTARELALLARALWRDFPERRALFRTRSLPYGAGTLAALNGYLDRIPGSVGLKTGFTCAAGYGLVAVAHRGERMLLGVVLGAPTPEQRDERMDVLLERAAAREIDDATPTLASLAGRRDQGAERTPVPRVLARVCLDTGPDRTPTGWVLDLGATTAMEDARRDARAHIRAHPELLRGGRAHGVPRLLDTLVFRVWVAGLDEEQARAACAILRPEGTVCLALSPVMARRAFERARALEASSGP